MRTWCFSVVAAAALVLAPAGPCPAGLFTHRPYDLSLGPYVGTGGYSYNVAYGYYLPFISNGPAYTPFSIPYDRPYYPPRPLFSRPAPTATATEEASLGPPGSFPLLLRQDERPAVIELRVPAQATVWFNGAKTSQEGADRAFQTPPLPPGSAYLYEVRARWSDDGTPVEQTKAIRVRAGERARIVFSAD
jgi:uncharacterized protein (TIGR03000 family)